MSIRLKKGHIDDIKRHAERTYPEECCGFLLGRIEDGLNVVVEAHPGVNERADSRHSRYEITPQQYRRADLYAQEKGLGIVGYYHSHPDHPAAPSAYDLEHSCWPGESYIIVSVRNGTAADVNSFAKPDYTRFEPEEMIVEE